MNTQTDDIVGWYFTVHYWQSKEEFQYPTKFMNPDRDTAAAAVRSAFEIQFPHAVIQSVEWGAPIFKRHQGWGDGKWTEGFKA